MFERKHACTSGRITIHIYRFLVQLLRFLIVSVTPVDVTAKRP